jgi:hypothetical protein
VGNVLYCTLHSSLVPVMIQRSLASRDSILAIGFFGASQLTAAAAALIRLPMSIGYLGTHNFGLLLTIVALFPWLGLLTGGSRIAVRNLLSSLPNDEVFGAWRQQLTLARTLALKLFVFGSIVTGLFAWVGGHFYPGQLGAELQMCLPLLLVYFSSSPILGALAGGADALGRHNLYAGLGSIAAVLSIPATWLGVHYHLTLWWFLFVASATFWMPAAGTWLWFVSTFLRHGKISRGTLTIRGLINSSSQGLGILFSSGFDVAIVASVLGVSVAGSYGISARLFGTLMIPAAALAPSQFRHFAQLRAQDQALPKIKRDVRLVFMRNLALTLVVATLVLAVYEYLFHLLSDGKYHTTLTLGLSLAVSTTLSAMFATFFAAAAGSSGIIVGRKFSVMIGFLNLILTAGLTRGLGIIGPSIASSVCFGLGIVLWIRQIKKFPEFLSNA